VKRIGFWDTMLLKLSVNRLQLPQNQTVIMENGEAGDEKGSSNTKLSHLDNPFLICVKLAR
jgi:hypothetical protein